MKRVMRVLAAALYLGVVFGPSANGQTQAQSSETATVLTEDVAGVPGDENKIVVRTVKEVTGTGRKVADSVATSVLTEDFVPNPENGGGVVFRYVGDPHPNPNDPWSDAAANAFSSIGFYRMNPDVRAHLKLPKDRGLIVARVAPNSPEYRMGLREGDIVLYLGDVAIASPADLLRAVKRLEDDKDGQLAILRDGKKVTLLVQPVKQYGLGERVPERTVYAIGVTTAPVDPLLRRQLNLPEGQALAVRHIDENGPASKVKLAVGDLLLAINGIPVGNEASLSKLIQDNGAKPAELKVIHEGEQKTITLTPESRKSRVPVKLEGKYLELRFQESAPGQGQVFSGQGQTFSLNNLAIGVRTDQPLIGTTIGRVDPRRDGSGHRISDTVTLNPHPPTSARTTARSQPSQAVGESDAVAKKLGEMSAQIDSLRKSIEELAKSIKEKK